MSDWMILAALASVIAAASALTFAAIHAAKFEKCQHRKGHKDVGL